MRTLSAIVFLFTAALSWAQFYDYRTLTVPGGNRPSNGTTLDVVVSANGRFVAFITDKPHLRERDDLTSFDIYLYDRTARKVRWVNIDESGMRIEPNSERHDKRILHVSDHGDVAFERWRTSGLYGTSVFLYSAKTRRSRKLVDGEAVKASVVLNSLSTDGRYLGLTIGYNWRRYDVVSAETEPLLSPILSPDGKWQLFVSDRRDLQPPLPTGKRYGLYANRIGTEEQFLAYAGDRFWGAAVSNGGRRVVFGAEGVGVTPTDIYSFLDAFVYDRQSGTMRQLTLDSLGAPIKREVRITVAADTTATAFQVLDRSAPNFGHYYFRSDITGKVALLYDRFTGLSADPRISDSGHHVTLPNGQALVYQVSDGSRLYADSDVPGVPIYGQVKKMVLAEAGQVLYYQIAPDYHRSPDVTPAIYRYRIATGTHERVVQGNQQLCGVTEDGRWLVYSIYGEMNVPFSSYSAVVVRNLERGEERVIASSPNAASGGVSAPTISRTGAYVCYTSTIPNEVPGDTNGTNPDVILYSIGSRQKYLVSKGPDGKQFAKGATNGIMLPDGRTVAFLAIGLPAPGDFYPDERYGWPVVRDAVSNRSTVLPMAPELSNVDGFPIPEVSMTGRFLTYQASASAGDLQMKGIQFDLTNGKWLDIPIATARSQSGFGVSDDREVIFMIDDYNRLIYTAVHTSSKRIVTLDTGRWLDGGSDDFQADVDHHSGLIYHSMNDFLGTMRVRFPDSP